MTPEEIAQSINDMLARKERKDLEQLGRAQTQKAQNK